MGPTRGKRKVFERIVDDHKFIVYRFPHLYEHEGVRGSFGVQIHPVKRGDFEPFFLEDGNTWGTLDGAKGAIEKYLRGELL